MPELRTPEVERYWRAFCQHSDVTADQRYDVFDFGDSPEMADELVALVITAPSELPPDCCWSTSRSQSRFPRLGPTAWSSTGVGIPLACCGQPRSR